MDSVYSLLNTLCESICVEDRGISDKTAIRRCRKKAFEILFEAGNGTKFSSQNVNISEDLQVCIFEYRLRAHTVNKKNHVTELERCLESLAKNSGAVTELSSVLEFLLHLRDTKENTSNVNGKNFFVSVNGKSK